MKKICFLILLFVGCMVHTQAQVGINTTSPFATLDVVKEPSGTVADGIIAPNLLLSELIARNALYATNQSGSFVYVTAIDATPAGKTRNVVTAGYYYFDGTEWKHFNDKLQTADNGLSVGTTANVQLGGKLSQPTEIETQNQKLTISNTGGADTGLQLPTGATSGHVLTSDASGNATWNAPGFSVFQTIAGERSDYLSYIATPKTHQVIDTKLTVQFPSDNATYLVTLGIYLIDSTNLDPTVPINHRYAVQLMPTDAIANWNSTIDRYPGSYEAYNLPGWNRIYYSQAITIKPGQPTLAHLMIAVVFPTVTGTVEVAFGENAPGMQPQATGGSYVRIN